MYKVVRRYHQLEFCHWTGDVNDFIKVKQAVGGRSEDVKRFQLDIAETSYRKYTYQAEMCTPGWWVTDLLIPQQLKRNPQY